MYTERVLNSIGSEYLKKKKQQCVGRKRRKVRRSMLEHFQE